MILAWISSVHFQGEHEIEVLQSQISSGFSIAASHVSHMIKLAQIILKVIGSIASFEGGFYVLSSTTQEMNKIRRSETGFTCKNPHCNGKNICSHMVALVLSGKISVSELLINSRKSPQLQLILHTNVAQAGNRRVVNQLRSGKKKNEKFGGRRSSLSDRVIPVPVPLPASSSSSSAESSSESSETDNETESEESSDSEPKPAKKRTAAQPGFFLFFSLLTFSSSSRLFNAE